VTISGTIRYQDAGGGVPGVTVTLGNVSTTATAADGSFALSVSSGTQATLRPSFAAGPGSALSAGDAVAILQYIVGLRSLTPAQILAADTTGNGAVSAQDASAILQFLVGLTPTLPVVSQCSSWWAFVPHAAPVPGQTQIGPNVTAVPCELGAIGFSSLAQSVANQDFAAVLFGDVTGNWAPSSAPSEVASNALRIGPARRFARYGREYFRAPIRLITRDPVYGAELTVRFDPRAFRAARFRAADPASGILVAQKRGSGELRVALARTTPLPLGLIGWVEVRPLSPRVSARSLTLGDARVFGAD
jgi:hypothetical protein